MENLKEVKVNVGQEYVLNKYKNKKLHTFHFKNIRNIENNTFSNDMYCDEKLSFPIINKVFQSCEDEFYLTIYKSRTIFNSQNEYQISHKDAYCENSVYSIENEETCTFDRYIKGEDLSNLIKNFDISKYKLKVYKNTEKFYYLTINEPMFILHIKIRLTSKNLIKKNDEKETYKAKAHVNIGFEFYTCSSCNKIIDIFNDEEKVQLGTYFYNNEKNFKLTMIYKELITEKNKILWRIYKDMLIFNKVTNKIYLIKNFHICCNNNRIKYLNPLKIRDITFSTQQLNNLFFCIDINHVNLFINHVNDFLKNKYENIYHFSLKDVKNNIVFDKQQNIEATLIHILLIKIKYNIKNTLLASYLLYVKQYNNKIFELIKNCKSDKEILNKLCVSYKDLKSFRPCYFSYLALCSKYIKNKDYAKKLLKSKKTISPIYFSNLLRENFIHQYAKYNSEKKFINEIYKTQDYILSDTCDMFREIKHKNKEYKIDTSLSIREIHDILSKDINKIFNKNKKIPRDKKLLSIIKDWEFNNIKYSLATSTYELIEVGTDMGICVGSYGEKAIKKICYILIGYYDNKPVTCIEFNKTKENFNIEQVKKKYNKFADKEEIQYIINKCKENNIEYDCYDVQQVLKENEKTAMNFDLVF